MAPPAPYDPYTCYPVPPVAMPSPAPVTVSTSYAPALVGSLFSGWVF